jgi:hypothetical protein
VGDDKPLLAGAVRLYRDYKQECSIVETTKENPRDAGLEVCRLKLGMDAEAKMIAALPLLLRDVEVIAASDRELAGEDGEAPLFTDTAVKLEVSVGDVQRIAEDYARALPPAEVIPPGARVRRGSRRGYKPKGRNLTA